MVSKGLIFVVWKLHLPCDPVTYYPSFPLSYFDHLMEVFAPSMPLMSASSSGGDLPFIEEEGDDDSVFNVCLQI